MVGVGEGGREWSDEEKVERIAAAGFEGILVFLLPEGREALRLQELLDRHSLAFGLGSFATSADQLAGDLAAAAAFEPRFVNAQVMDYLLRGDAAVDRVAALVEVAERAALPFLLETHRGCLTQDLLRTVALTEAMSELRLTLDLSHYVVAGQLPLMPGELWPIPPAIEALFERLFEHTACIHGRVSNGNQVQVDVGPDGHHPAADHFIRWWSRTAACWRASARPGDVLPFVCELGPPPYAITAVPERGDRERELSDRWEQALVLKRTAESLWATLPESA